MWIEITQPTDLPVLKSYSQLHQCLHPRIHTAVVQPPPGTKTHPVWRTLYPFLTWNQLNQTESKCLIEPLTRRSDKLAISKAQYRQPGTSAIPSWGPWLEVHQRSRRSKGMESMQLKYNHQNWCRISCPEPVLVWVFSTALPSQFHHLLLNPPTMDPTGQSQHSKLNADWITQTL